MEAILHPLLALFSAFLRSFLAGNMSGTLDRSVANRPIQVCFNLFGDYFPVTSRHFIVKLIKCLCRI